MKQGEMARNIIVENTINLEQMSKKKKKIAHKEMVFILLF